MKKDINNKNKDITTNPIEKIKQISAKGEGNIVKLKTFKSPKTGLDSRVFIAFASIFSILLVLLVVRIAFLQFVDGEDLKRKAFSQQTINEIINPDRGNIYDATGKSLAISAKVDTVTIAPKELVKKTDEDTKAYKELIATGLSEIFALDYQETFDKVYSSNNIETIARQVEKDKIDELENWMDENKISTGINIDEDVKRYYPYETVASNLLGFCGTNNQGLSGLEYTWNNVLTGTPGKFVSSQGSNLQEIPNTEETYIPAENGSDIILTIDYNVQKIVEKYLEQAVSTYEATKGGNAIIMDPQTGNILAMASYPNYNLNDPFTPISDLGTEFAEESIYRMWATRTVSDTYEPGSTFKILTSAIALEENITETDIANDFYCNGYEEFDDVNGSTLKIKCWRVQPHGALSLRGALENSCNPSFMQLGDRIGVSTMYKYYDAFGLFDSTNSTIYGEQGSIFLAADKVGPVEEATMSFGQGLNITPLQLITAVSSIANDGILMQPRIVDSVINSDTGAITEIPVTEVRQVISEETSNEVVGLMQSVVVTGTGSNASVDGYSIGGKTGTSENLLSVASSDYDDYIASFVGISPVEDTNVVILLTLHNPTNEKYGYQGGQVAAPVVSQILSEVLPYLNVPSDNVEVENTNLITLPNIQNKTITEANKILEEAGFNTTIYSNEDYNNTLVANQNPKPGASLGKDSTIVLYGTDNNIATSVTVPDLNGMSVSQATATLKSNKLNISIEGTGIVVSQDYQKDENVPEGTIVKVTLKPTLTDAQ